MPRKLKRFIQKLRRFTKRLRLWVKLCLLLVILGVLGGIFLKDNLTESYRGWRVSQLVSKARAYAAAGNWEEAHRTATEAWKKQETLAATRIFFEAAVEVQDPGRFALAVELFRHPDAGLEDRIKTLEYVLDNNVVPAATKMLEDLPSANLEMPAMRFQVIRYHLLSQNPGEAIELVDSAPAKDQHPEFDLLLAKSLVLNESYFTRQEALKRIRSLIEGESRELALEAMRLLVVVPTYQLDPELITQLLKRFGEDDTLPAADLLRLDFFRISQEPSRRTELIDQAIEEYQDEELELLISWLFLLEEYQLVIDLTEPDPLPENEQREAGEENKERDEGGEQDGLENEGDQGNEATTEGSEEGTDGIFPFPNAPGVSNLSPTLFKYRMKAMIEIDLAEQIAAELLHAPSKIPEVPLLLARVGVMTYLGREAEALDLWRQAFRQAERVTSVNWNIKIAETAKRLEKENLLMEALARCIEHPRSVVPSEEELTQMLSWLYQQDNPVRHQKIVASLLEKRPDDPVLLNSYHFFRALGGKTTQSDLQKVQALVAQYPDKVEYRKTLALMQVQLEAPKQALETVTDLESELDDWPSDLAAIHAAALGALGREKEANEMVAKVKWQEMPSSHVLAFRRLLPLKVRGQVEASFLQTLLFRQALFGTPGPDDLKMMKSLVAKEPDRLDYRATLALGLLRNDDPKEALKTLTGSGAEPSGMPPVNTAIYAAALQRLERTDEARSIVAGIPWRNIPFSEAQALRSLLEQETETEEPSEEEPATGEPSEGESE